MSTINNTKSHTLVGGTSSADDITNSGSYVTISASSGDDFIETSGEVEVTVLGGDGNDVVRTGYGILGHVYVSGGAGDDNLTCNSGINVTISGDAGNDTISNYSGYQHVLITGGAGNDSVYSNGMYSTVSGGTGDDTINSYNEKSLVDGDAGNDSISSSGDYETISGGADNDTIRNLSGYSVTMSGGAGNDIIYTDGGRPSMSGGAGSDTITNNDGYNVTINGGAGSDYIHLSHYSSNVIQYASGDGTDTVYGFGANDTLQITKGSYSTTASGNDVIVKVGSGSINLKDAKGKTYTITTSSGDIAAAVSDLFAEDNYTRSESTNLSALVAQKDATDFENVSSEKTVQENLLTYAGS